MGYIIRALEFSGLFKQGNSAAVNSHGPAGRSVSDNFRRYLHFSQQTGTCSYPELDESNPYIITYFFKKSGILLD